MGVTFERGGLIVLGKARKKFWPGVVGGFVYVARRTGGDRRADIVSVNFYFFLTTKKKCIYTGNLDNLYFLKIR